MYCHACGKPLPEGTTVCWYCGAHQRPTPPPGWRTQEVQPRHPGSGMLDLSGQPPRQAPATAPQASRGMEGQVAPREAERPNFTNRVSTGKRTNTMPLLVMGVLGLILLLLMVSNQYLKTQIKHEALNLPKPFKPCVEAVFMTKSTLDLAGQGMTAKEANENPGIQAQKKRCPSLKIKKVKGGWEVEAFPKRLDDTTCHIWAKPGTKVDTDCHAALKAMPESEEKQAPVKKPSRPVKDA